MWNVPGVRSPGLLVGMALAVLAPLLLVIPAVVESPAAPAASVAGGDRELSILALGSAAGLLAVPVPAPVTPDAVPEPAPAAPASAVSAVPVSVDPDLADPGVRALQQKLVDLGYLVGEIDGKLGSSTRHGITAFQKVEGLQRTGDPDAATLARLETATRPTPAFPTPGDHIEVDIPRQVVFLVRGGEVAAVSPTSTGNNKLFTSQGWTRRAVTPNGRYEIFFKRQGWRDAPLGRLYRPAYFNGGIALHGSTSIPTSPASHGCVRLPMAFADFILDNAPVGMVVYVHGGPHGTNPQPELDQDPNPGPEVLPVPESPDDSGLNVVNLVDDLLNPGS